MKNTNFAFFVFFTFISLVAFSGCVTQSVNEKKDDEAVFFPPPPDLPRYQFLVGMSGSDFFEEEVSGLDSFLGARKDHYRLKKPYGVTVKDGAVYVTDTQTSLWKFDMVKRRFHRIVGDKGLGKIVQPINVSSDSEGNKYVADPIRSAVLKYDKKDFFVKAYTSPNPWKPVDAEVFDDLLYVLDATHAKGGVKVFDLKSGEIIDTLGQSGPQDQRIKIGSNMAFDTEGYLYVMDAGAFRIMKYDRDGHYRGHLGGPGDSPGFFGRPRGVAIDKEGIVYAVDAAFDVVQVFDPSGQLLTILGTPGTAPGTLTLPAAIYLDYENVKYFKEYAAPGFEIEYLVFVVSQFHDVNAISVYGYGRMAGKKYPTNDQMMEELKERLLKNQGEQ